MVKIVTLFLIAILALAMFGRFRIPGLDKRKPLKCQRCGKYRIGKSGCDCRIKGP